MCTTMIITKGATADGSMVVTHSDDDELADQRVIRVPAADHPEGSLRPIMPESYPYPRMVTSGRGPGYDTAGWAATEPIGEIPEVAHTYAYFDGNYGIVNEHNLMMGECTNGAKCEPHYVTAEEAAETDQHRRLFYSSELSRVALERCRTAREAIALMGELIDKYGYYSTGETLLVSDEDEGWVFEMCALPSETRHSAWIAQRVPDGEAFVAANEFRIREVPSQDYEQIHSQTLVEDLQAVGWWDPKDGRLDWLRAVSPGEYNHPYYSLRRVWRIFDRMNPDLGLSPWVQDGYTTAYPFSIAPNHKLGLEEIFSLYRDHYEGTQFDLTMGTAAGPYGDPNRFAGRYDGNQNDVTNGITTYGAWERPISVFYQGYSFVLQTRPNVPEPARCLMWFAPDISYTSVFAPFYVKCTEFPWSYQSGDPRQFDRTSAWWAFDFVANWARLNFQRMTRADILPLQAKKEREARAAIAAVDDDVRDDPERALQTITDFGIANAGSLLDAWWSLADRLVAKYSDGYIGPPAETRASPTPIGYPATWLTATDYANGPVSYAMKG
jgi:dipeptidase